MMVKGDQNMGAVACFALEFRPAQVIKKQVVFLVGSKPPLSEKRICRSDADICPYIYIYILYTEREREREPKLNYKRNNQNTNNKERVNAESNKYKLKNIDN